MRWQEPPLPLEARCDSRLVSPNPSRGPRLERPRGPPVDGAADRSRSGRAPRYPRDAAARRPQASRFPSMDSHRPGVTRFVHVGLVVEDLDETVRFLALLGFDCGEPGVFGGEWIGRIIALENVTVEIVMVRAPDGSDVFEVVRFHSPSAGAQEPAPAANRPGLRHIAFKV